METMERTNTPLRELGPVALEEFLRAYYFEVDHDLGGSGVEDFSLREVRELTGLTPEEMDAVVFHDSRTLGDPALLEVLAAHLGLGGPQQVMATHGSSEAIFLTMTALLGPGDDVVVLDPIYPQLAALAEGIGCRLRRWPLRRERAFRPDLEEGLALLGPETRMVVVNFPHNPTGATLAPAEQDALVAAVERTGAYLVWDGAFSRMTYDRPPLPDPLLRYDRTVSFGTLSKSYGLPGLRVGWCAAAPDVLKRFESLRDYTLLHLSPLVELIARRVLAVGDRLIGIRRAQAARNRTRVAAWVEAQGGRVEWVPPEGGVSSFPRLPAVRDVDRFCHRLAAERRILIVPGSCFGAPEHVRLGLGGATADLEEGLERIADLLVDEEDR